MGGGVQFVMILGQIMMAELLAGTIHISQILYYEVLYLLYDILILVVECYFY